MFKAVSNKVDFPAQELETLAFWKAHDTFAKSLAARRGSPEYVFYDGPPFATGLPHYGHLLAGTIKDIIPRYQTMRGRYVERRFGWDCHGLPVEYEVEQALKISGKREIEKLGVDVFNERCRSIVLRYSGEWREVVTRMGRWVDFDHDYKTMDSAYMESIWWVFKTLWDKGLIYKGNKILPYCPRCATPLSNFETNQGYVDVQDPAITVRFRLADASDTFFLVWTTTPWTLPSNMALAVGPKMRYLKVRDGQTIYILAKERLSVYYRKPEQIEILAEVSGAELVGVHYTPLFPYFADRAGAFRVISGDFVSSEDGAGIVHIAPGFGEDDYAAAQASGIPVVCPMDEEGRFTAEVPDYAGREVKEADADIIRRLKQEGALVHQSTIQHSYPHCWRCDKPLLYRAISTWFVRVESLRERVLAANQATDWMPARLKDGRFGKWLEQARDWAISRNRYWGAPLPIWRSADGQETLCIGSIEELARRSGQTVTDLHKHFVDKITLPSSEGRGSLTRVPEVLDCWFESGAMPYAQSHYPFENREKFESHFPADFIAEGLDQTRGWFYTLMVLSTALFDKPAFRHVIVNGLVLAADGRKMSKRLKNYPDPAHIIETYGADALRLYLVNSPVVRAESLRFFEAGVQDLMRHILIPLWNAHSFFVTYANVDGWTPGNGCRMSNVEGQPANLLDRWIRSSLEALCVEVTLALDGYDLQRAVRPFVHFIENLTNWYIRRSRRRFWKSQDDADKAEAYETLYSVLLTLSKIAAPFTPFVSEAIYRALRTEAMPESVHLCDFPQGDEFRRDRALEQRMADVMTVVGLARSLRSAHDLKVRQPLARMWVVCRDAARLASIAERQDLVLDELNVKEACFLERETGFATVKSKADFRKLGPRLGSRMKHAAGAIAALKAEQVETLAAGVSLTIQLDGEPFVLEPGDMTIEHIPHAGHVVAAEGGFVVALDTQRTPALECEGLAREFVNKAQNMRKAADLDVTTRIRLEVSGASEVRAALDTHGDYVRTEVLAVTCEWRHDASAEAQSMELNGHACAIRLMPV